MIVSYAVEHFITVTVSEARGDLNEILKEAKKKPRGSLATPTKAIRTTPQPKESQKLTKKKPKGNPKETERPGHSKGVQKIERPSWVPLHAAQLSISITGLFLALGMKDAVMCLCKWKYECVIPA